MTVLSEEDIKAKILLAKEMIKSCHRLQSILEKAKTTQPDMVKRK